MTEITSTSAVRVPGATLQYEVTGTGPVLLLIHGGVSDSSMLKEFAGRLADRYAVVTYDRRGYGDSALEDPDQEQSVALHADDAHRLLSELTDEPADVPDSAAGRSSGSSSPAAIPNRSGRWWRSSRRSLSSCPTASGSTPTAKRRTRSTGATGPGAALAKFSNMVRDGSEAEAAGPPSDPDPEMLEFIARTGRNVEFFFRHEYMQFGGWLRTWTRVARPPAGS
jgi:pimeloyl-ACP methyl ester carboxylesterase